MSKFKWDESFTHKNEPPKCEAPQPKLMQELKLKSVLMTEFLKDWQSFIANGENDLSPIDVAERFWLLGRTSVMAEVEVELQETEYGKKTRLEATIPSEIEVEKAYWKVFFKERENFTKDENFSWVSGAKAATKVFFEILRGEKK